MTTPQLIWDVGTAYDFFISLYTLHHPSDFGLRGAWAVGVRSRLPTAEREFLNNVMTFMHWPLDWVYALPTPKDAATALEALAGLPPAARLPALSSLGEHKEWGEVYLNVAERGAWSEQDVKILQGLFNKEKKAYGEQMPKEFYTNSLDWWSRTVEFGEQYLQALQTYHDVFFAEDEERIEPALHQAVAQAQTLAKKLPVEKLLEEISQGVHFSKAPDVEKIILIPSFWASPLLLYGPKTKEHMMLAFGGRPSNASLVPGDVVPDALFRALKALADPTRLRILRYLSTEPLSPSELSRRLRLRAPTVVHHLHTLRLAGLVQLKMSYDGKLYQARPEMIKATYGRLDAFLDESQQLDASDRNA